MASALVNNIGPVPESFLDCPSSSGAYPSYGWLSPRISFSRDIADDDDKPPQLTTAAEAIEKPDKRPSPSSSSPSPPLPPENADLVNDLVIDFEFHCLDDPVTMLPADELFSDGKLVPLQLAPVRVPAESSSSSTPAVTAAGIRSPEAPQKSRQSAAEVSGSDPYTFSPRAPRCSSRWRELLGLKRAAQNNNNSPSKPDAEKAAAAASASASAAAKNYNSRILRHFLHRSTKSCSFDSSLSLPLLRDSDSESLSISSSRLSLSSSSSSGPDHDDLPRLSLDSDKPRRIPISLGRNPARLRVSSQPSATEPPSRAPYYHHRETTYHNHHPPRTRTTMTTTASSSSSMRSSVAASGRIGRSPMRRASDATTIPPRGTSVDSPRMNPSGKIVFQSLERSSSSPSSFNGGPRVKHWGMERSYSANVRVTPVLNVPVCSLRGSSKSVSVFGFGQLFSSSSSPQKKEMTSVASGRSSGGGAKSCGGRTERS